jgi:hypothetical protein
MSSKEVTLGEYLEDLRSQRAKLDSLISAIEERLGESESSENTTGNGRARAAHGTYYRMTIGDAAIHYLQSVGSPQLTADIATGLLQGGLRSNSKSLYRTVYNTLNIRCDKGDVFKDGAKWGLTEWQQK